MIRLNASLYWCLLSLIILSGGFYFWKSKSGFYDSNKSLYNNLWWYLLWLVLPILGTILGLILKIAWLTWTEIKQMYAEFYRFTNIERTIGGFVELFIFFCLLCFFGFISVFSFPIIWNALSSNFSGIVIQYLLLFAVGVVGFLFPIFMIVINVKSNKYYSAYLTIVGALLLYLWLVNFFPNMWLKALLLIIILLITFPIAYSDWKSPKWSYIVLGLVVVVVFSLGILIISDTYGVKASKINLYDSIENVTINVSCTTPSGEILAEHMLYCSYVPQIHNISGNMSILYKTGLTNNTGYVGYIYAQEEMEFIRLNITAQNETNITLKLVGEFVPTYLTKQEYDSNKSKFINYFFGLLALCLITLPRFFIDFKSKA